MLYPGQSRTVTTDDVTYGNYVYLNMRIRKLPEAKGGLEATHKLQRLAKIEAKSAVSYTSPDIVLDRETPVKLQLGLIKAVGSGSTMMHMPAEQEGF